MRDSIWSLLPPFVVLILGYTCRRIPFAIPLALLFGVLLASILSTNLDLLPGLYLGVDKLWANLDVGVLLNPKTFWDSWNGFICIFLFILGILVTLMRHSGGAYAYAGRVRPWLKSKKGAESSSLILSMIFFIDDYFSSLTVGSVMTPLTDKFKIPRVKLAFLIDAMAAPLAILCPFSSWVAAIIGFLKENGIHAENAAHTLVLTPPFTAYLSVLPYIVYSFLIMGSVWFIVIRRISFGSMNKHERIAASTGNLFGGGNKNERRVRDMHKRNEARASMADFLLPLTILLISIASGLLISGDAALFGGNHSLLNALQNASAAKGLFTGGVSTFLFTTTYFLARKKVHLSELPGLMWDGICLIAPAVLILILAWTLGDILRSELHTGKYLAGVLFGNIPLWLLPFIAYITALLVAFATGSSWGAAAILFPIALPLVLALSNAAQPTFPQDVPLLYPVLGAVLSGCISGDHISPLSDTTFMSATSTGCPHFDHVQTQMNYAIPVIFSTCITFVFIGLLASSGFWLGLVLPILIGLVTSFTTLSFLNKKLV